MRRILGTLVVAVVVLLLTGIAYLWLVPPELLRVGAAYSAKIVCSNLFLAGRDPDEVLSNDIQAPGIALLKLMRVSVDRERGLVHAGFLGFIGNGVAVRTPRAGCTVMPRGEATSALASGKLIADAVPPTGVSIATGVKGGAAAADAAFYEVLANEDLAGPGMRAIVILDHGRVVAERYADGFTAQTPLLGWSMTKTVTAGLVGMLIKDGRLTLEASGYWPAGDGREHIRIADLLSMSSGLRFNEAYGTVSDVTSMLYLEPDMAKFAMSQPLIHPVGSTWSYSSGTALIISHLVQAAAGGDAVQYASEHLFKPLGMHSAVLECDAHGTPVGSSYMYATARDWAKYAQLLVQDGIWEGQPLLPEGYVDMMATPVAASGGQYGNGQVWLYGSDGVTAGVNPDAAFGIPPDTFWMFGHDGQSIAIVRSRQLVVVRLGLTPYTARYSPQALLRAVLEIPATAPPPAT